MRRSKPFYIFALVMLATCTLVGDKSNIQVARANIARASGASQNDLIPLVEGNTDFAFDLYHQLVEDEDGNLIFSPYSISLAFVMLYAGATNDSATQMADVFHYRLPSEQLHSAFNALDLTLQPLETELPTPTPAGNAFFEIPADDLTLTIANAIWGQEGFPFEETFLETLALNYGAGINLVNFAGNIEQAYQMMNHWIEEVTRGRIVDMPPRDAISTETKLALINAIYFKGEWTYPFREENTHNNTFHLVDASEVTVPMMVNDFAYMQCVQGNGYNAIELTYGKSTNAAMMILIPDTGSFYQIEANLDTKLFTDILAGLTTTNMLTFTMPRFKFETEVNLKTILSKMGMTAPFSEDASFSGISPNELFIDYVGHKATISVDEQGTEATGTTSVFMYLMGIMSRCTNEVKADRPFIFVIYDRPTNTVLFLGRVMNPAA